MFAYFIPFLLIGIGVFQSIAPLLRRRDQIFEKFVSKDISTLRESGHAKVLREYREDVNLGLSGVKFFAGLQILGSYALCSVVAFFLLGLCESVVKTGWFNGDTGDAIAAFVIPVLGVIFWEKISARKDKLLDEVSDVLDLYPDK